MTYAIFASRTAGVHATANETGVIAFAATLTVTALPPAAAQWAGASNVTV